MVKVATINPREIKKIGADQQKLPVEIEVENPYRDAVILNEMAKATSKDEVSHFENYFESHFGRCISLKNFQLLGTGNS